MTSVAKGLSIFHFLYPVQRKTVPWPNVENLVEWDLKNVQYRGKRYGLLVFLGYPMNCIGYWTKGTYIYIIIYYYYSTYSAVILSAYISSDHTQKQRFRQ